MTEEVEALRRSGEWRHAPAQFRVLEALARRIPAQDKQVQDLLRARLQEKLRAFHAHIEALQDNAHVPAKRSAAPCALAALNAQLRAARPAGANGGAELASARRFRDAWERQKALEQVAQSLARKPANAGPLNSHALVVRSLEWMAALSPQLLRRFVGYVEALQALEAAAQALPAPAGAAKSAARRVRVSRQRGFSRNSQSRGQG